MHGWMVNLIYSCNLQNANNAPHGIFLLFCDVLYINCVLPPWRPAAAGQCTRLLHCVPGPSTRPCCPAVQRPAPPTYLLLATASRLQHWTTLPPGETNSAARVGGFVVGSIFFFVFFFFKSVARHCVHDLFSYKANGHKGL